MTAFYVAALALTLSVGSAQAEQVPADRPAKQASVRSALAGYTNCLMGAVRDVLDDQAKSAQRQASFIIKSECGDLRGDFFLKVSNLYGLPIAKKDRRVDAWDAQIKEDVVRAVER